MAGDWIKMRSDLFTHPKVVRISSALKTDVLRTVGGLMSAWCLFDAHSIDGRLDGYGPETLDAHLRWDGFSDAMISVGWLEFEADQQQESLILPGFDTHNGDSAKRRAQDADRKRIVRKMSASEADKSRTREEKRREEIKDTPISPSGDSSSAASDNAAILDSYHAILPACQRIEVLNPKRRKRIAAAVKLAKQVCASQGWEYVPDQFWPAYWTQCAADKWMRGEVPNPNNPAWKQNLDVLLAEDRFASVMDKAIAAMRGGA